MYTLISVTPDVLIYAKAFDTLVEAKQFLKQDIVEMLHTVCSITYHDLDLLKWNTMDPEVLQIGTFQLATMTVDDVTVVLVNNYLEQKRLRRIFSWERMKRWVFMP